MSENSNFEITPDIYTLRSLVIPSPMDYAKEIGEIVERNGARLYGNQGVTLVGRGGVQRMIAVERVLNPDELRGDMQQVGRAVSPDYETVEVVEAVKYYRKKDTMIGLEFDDESSSRLLHKILRARNLTGLDRPYDETPHIIVTATNDVRRSTEICDEINLAGILPIELTLGPALPHLSKMILSNPTLKQMEYADSQ